MHTTICMNNTTCSYMNSMYQPGDNLSMGQGAAQQWHEQALHAALADVHSQRAMHHTADGQVYQLQQLPGFVHQQQQQQQQQQQPINMFNFAAFDAADAPFDPFAQVGGSFSNQNLVLHSADAGLSFLN